MIETDQQRRWWFATHPEFSSSYRGKKSANDGGEDTESQSPASDFGDAWEDQLLREIKSQYESEFASRTPAERYASLWGDASNNAAIYGMSDVPTVPNMFDKVRDMLNYFEQNHPVFMTDPNWTLELAKRGFKNAAELARVAEQIARGHAYQKHVVGQVEYPEISSREEFQKLIQRILSNPTEWKRLEGGRSAYWDKKTGTVVIRDPRHPDGGTAFRPDTGKRYYDENLRR